MSDDTPTLIIDPDDEAHAQTIIDTLDLDESEITLTTSDRVVHLTDSQTAAVGLDFPALTECPDCGHTVLEAIANNRDKVTLGLDGEGGISHREHEHPITELYSLLQCPECGAVLVEDAEIVHDDLTT